MTPPREGGPDGHTPQDHRHVWPTVRGFAATRLLGNLFVRAPYVFITEISRGLGVSVETMTVVLGVRELGGLGSPVAGRLVDNGHGAAVIAAGGVLVGISCLLAATPWFPVFVVVMVLGAFAKNSIDLAQNAWVGHEVPVTKRARVIGFIETTWAGSFLLGVPVIGFATDRFGWRSGFLITGPILALLAVGSGASLRRSQQGAAEDEPVGAPAARPTGSTATSTGSAATHHALEAIANPARLRRAIWAFFCLQPFSQMLVFAVNGDWFAGHLAMSNTQLSFATAALGVAELVGVAWVIAYADRLGPVRVGGVAIGLAAIPSLILIAMSNSAVGNSAVFGVAMLLLMDLAMEASFVATLPIVTELDVDNRGRSVAQAFVVMLVSRAVASAAGGAIYTRLGFNATLLTSATLCVAGCAALTWARRGPRLEAT